LQILPGSCPRLKLLPNLIEGQQIIWRSFELGNQVLKNGPSASASEIVDGIEAQAMTILHC